MKQAIAPSLKKKRRRKEAEMPIVQLLLPGLVQGSHRLVLHKETRVLSLMGDIGDGPCLLAQELFSDNEMRVLLPILEAFPFYCPYEELLASVTSQIVTSNNVARWRLHLQEAQRDGTWRQELRPVQRALSTLRQKLHSFQLEVSTVRERGCSLTSLTSTSSHDFNEE